MMQMITHTDQLIVHIWIVYTLLFLFYASKKVPKRNNTLLVMSTHTPQILIFNCILNEKLKEKKKNKQDPWRNA